MSSVWVLYLFVPVLVGLLIAEYKQDIFRVIKVHLFDADEDTIHDVQQIIMYPSELTDAGWTALVFVPSARQNKEKRTAIRETWGEMIQKYNSQPSNKNRFILKFAVGSESCSVHESDLINEYSCQRWNASAPEEAEKDDEWTAIETVPAVNTNTNSSESYRRYYGLQSLSFVIHHPVILTKLGTYMDERRQGQISVKLVESSTQKEIVSSMFSGVKAGRVIGTHRYRPVEQYLLPKGFHGTLLYDSSDVGNTDMTGWNESLTTRPNHNITGLIQFLPEEAHLPDGHYEDVVRWRADPIHLVSFMFKIHELDKLRQHVANQNSRNKEVTQRNEVLTSELAAESKQHNDMVFVDIVDVYRHIPDKLLRFFEWSTAELGFTYLVKADDDSYLDIERVGQRLDDLESAQRSSRGRSGGRVWMGRFRHNWLVERYGKWAEPEYSAQVYPRFACGSAYILSHSLASWLAANSRSLKTYQGEDVSMGIWLSAVYHTIVDEPLWLCEKDCISDMYAMPELSPEEMRNIYRDRITCGDPCGCD